MFRRWVMTVCAEMQSASAICLFVIPFTTQTMISFSRVLNGSGFAVRGARRRQPLNGRNEDLVLHGVVRRQAPART